jgi:pyruvate dehydrogenase E2 component (dihydrolipoamide acetyltransferase)
MAEFYEMPAISPTMELGTLVAWKIAEGEAFESSAVVAEVGTDKANMEAEIFDAGVLLKHLVSEGDEVPPGYPIAIWGLAADEDITSLVADFEARKAASAAAAEAPAPTEASAAPTAAVAPRAAPRAPAPTQKRSWQGKDLSADFADPPGDIRVQAPEPRVAASPLARKVAAERGVDLGRVQGTGPGGRVVRADVDQAASAVVSGAAVRPDEVVRNSPMRKTIARRLFASHSEIPTFFLTASFDAAAMVQLRGQLKGQLPDLRVSYNDILLVAVARALREHPDVNASWAPDAITQHGRVDVGIAVALRDGLITPVLRSADRMSLSELAGQVRILAGKAKEGKLTPEEYTGATFTVSNLGMFGIEHFTAIINPPEAAILAVGGITSVPTVGPDGQVAVGHTMKVTMTCDHRVIDGAVGARFLSTLRRYVESPWLLLV